MDQAAFEEELRLQLRQADRETRLLANINAALQRIDAGDYGYCEETGEPIGLPRLLLRVKAIVNVAGQPQPLALHGVQNIFHPSVTLPADAGRDGISRFVFITSGVAPEAVARLFDYFQPPQAE